MAGDAAWKIEFFVPSAAHDAFADALDPFVGALSLFPVEESGETRITGYGADAPDEAVLAAALAEIAGCFAVWRWWRDDASAWWLLPAVASLVAFAWLLSQIDADYAGRAFAAYGGVYIVASLGWLWWVEQRLPDRWDLIGGVLCLVGAAVILLGPRS